MSDVIDFPGKKARKKLRSKRKTLCKSGFHKWEIDPSQQFDVKRGKLVTVERCTRCSATRTSLR